MARPSLQLRAYALPDGVFLQVDGRADDERPEAWIGAKVGPNRARVDLPSGRYRVLMHDPRSKKRGPKLVASRLVRAGRGAKGMTPPGGGRTRGTAER
ncbi:MAG: hypothetical protein KF850_27535 [Labilithrix sp.]|nr:hypothetical protein [Labilithrix sp.]MBX3215822.1 hypothetical protein [Labilithrix sp.]